MNILLTHAYYLLEDEREQKIMKPYPPLGLLYVSSYLESKNIANYLFDSTFSSQEEQLAYIIDKKPKIICIYVNLMTKIQAIKLINVLKNEVFGFPTIVLGGPDITYNIENYLNAGADYLVIGEGEETTFELYQALTNKSDVKNVDGIAFKENAKIVQTNTRTKFKTLDQLPLPNRKAINLNKYLETWKEHHGKSSITVSTQRGCPYTCKWCSTAVYGQSYRRRPADKVVEELKIIYDTYAPDHIWFVDDVFTISHKWLESFREELNKQKVKISFECITRAERLSDEILALLKEIGCFRIWIGAESGSQKIIDAMDRRVDIKLVQKMIQKTNAIGIETGTFLMLGYPGETKIDIRSTIEYLKEARPTHYTITLAYPIKGTSLYEEIKHKFTNTIDWKTNTDREQDFIRTYKKSFYKFALALVTAEVAAAKKEYNLLFRIKLQIKIILLKLIMSGYLRDPN